MHRIVSCFVLGFCLLPAANLAYAQGKAEPKATPPQPVSTPSWSVNCVSGKDALDCRANYTILLKDSQQRLLSIVVRLAPKERNPTMLLQLPLGLFLPAGVTLQIDKQPPKPLVIQSCDALGCYAGLPIADPELAALQKGQMLRVSFQNLQKQDINIEVALAGFAGAYSKLKQ